MLTDDQRLRPDAAAHGDELVGAERIDLLVVPHVVRVRPALVLRSDAVLPAVGRGEAAARPADHRRSQPGDGLQQVGPKAAGLPPRLGHQAHLVEPDLARPTHADLKLRVVRRRRGLQFHRELLPGRRRCGQSPARPGPYRRPPTARPVRRRLRHEPKSSRGRLRRRESPTVAAPARRMPPTDSICRH